ncbi:MULTISPECIES: hypothetical protein [unclassified Bosea (in: a-proteobacteria)]|uniref:hypothetical protein n=1 Tax=unclassified Bosea (in: a-proteobacteria) TaxID=2653178 RepID=UPI000F7F3259|nr:MULTISPECIES: hypothetical protein [unclassified Bosea (in: a-proteobacteria)]
MLALATSDALNLLKSHLATHNSPSVEVIKALALVADQIGYDIVVIDDDDEGEPPLTLDANEIDEARARAMRGEIKDAVIHLGRALPGDFSVIADRIGDHLRSSK